MAKKQKRKSISLSRRYYAALRKLSQERGLSCSALVELAIEARVERIPTDAEADEILAEAEAATTTRRVHVHTEQTTHFTW